MAESTIFEPLLLPDPLPEPELLELALPIAPLSLPLGLVPLPELLELELLLAEPELEPLALEPLLDGTPELEACDPVLELGPGIPLPEPLPLLPFGLAEPPDPPSAGDIPDGALLPLALEGGLAWGLDDFVGPEHSHAPPATIAMTDAAREQAAIRPGRFGTPLLAARRNRVTKARLFVTTVHYVASYRSAHHGHFADPDGD